MRKIHSKNTSHFRVKGNIICFLILTILIVPINVFAKENQMQVIDSSQKEIEYFDSMSIDELNQYIDNQARTISQSQTDNRPSSKAKTTVTKKNLKNAWLAAAAIARKKGFPCAATLVEHSVLNKPYKEGCVKGNGLFGKKIKKTTVHKSIFKKMKKSKKSKLTGSTTFTKTTNADLFYALHKVNYKFTGYQVGKSMASYMATYNDVFDFAFDNKYKSLLTSCINNGAWLCQQTKVLHKIKVSIVMVP